MSGNTFLLGLHERKQPDVAWLEIDGSILRRDPESDVFYATLIVRKPAFLDLERVAALARLMNTVAPLPGNRAVTPDHFPKTVGVKAEIVGQLTPEEIEQSIKRLSPEKQREYRERSNQ